MKMFLNLELFSECLLFHLFLTNVEEYTRPAEELKHNDVFSVLVSVYQNLDCISE
jgi:hypothetical protein